MQAISSLAALTSLRSLVLADCGAITSNGVAALSSLSGLTNLAVVRCPRIADKGLALLANLPNLRRLDITGCSKVTPSSMLQMRLVHRVLMSLLSAVQKIKLLHTGSASSAVTACR